MNISSMYERRQYLTDDLFNEIINNSHHKLNALILPLIGGIMPLQNRRNFKLPVCKMKRFNNSFIMSNSYSYFK